MFVYACASVLLSKGNYTASAPVIKSELKNRLYEKAQANRHSRVCGNLYSREPSGYTLYIEVYFIILWDMDSRVRGNDGPKIILCRTVRVKPRHVAKKKRKNS